MTEDFHQQVREEEGRHNSGIEVGVLNPVEVRLSASVDRLFLWV
jgi:hypothetical protein